MSRVESGTTAGLVCISAQQPLSSSTVYTEQAVEFPLLLLIQGTFDLTVYCTYNGLPFSSVMCGIL